MKRPTDTQIRLLCGIRDHDNPYHGCAGRSQYGGRTVSVGSAEDRGWIVWNTDRRAYDLTLAGLEIIG